jgi:hypothetical protein
MTKGKTKQKGYAAIIKQYDESACNMIEDYTITLLWIDGEGVHIAVERMNETDEHFTIRIGSTYQIRGMTIKPEEISTEKADDREIHNVIISLVGAESTMRVYLRYPFDPDMYTSAYFEGNNIKFNGWSLGSQVFFYIKKFKLGDDIVLYADEDYDVDVMKIRINKISSVNENEGTWKAEMTIKKGSVKKDIAVNSGESFEFEGYKITYVDSTDVNVLLKIEKK